MIDLHIHSRYSDGDWGVGEVVAEAAWRGLAGIALTDHNGTWGNQEVEEAARQHELVSVQGIEITARFEGADVHILGYARAFDEQMLQEGLATTRAGYEARVREMVERCQHHGYPKINFADIQARRTDHANPSYISYDVARQLMQVYQLAWDEARALTTRGGACHVSYGDWTLSPAAAIALLHQAGGQAFLAHPGIIIHEAGRATLDRLLSVLRPATLDGIEVQHPFHEDVLIQELERYCEEHRLLVSGGSDWHGPGRYHHGAFGKYGIDDAAFERLVA